MRHVVADGRDLVGVAQDARAGSRELAAHALDGATMATGGQILIEAMVIRS